MEDVCWGERPEKEGRLVELVGDRNPGAREAREEKEVTGEERWKRVGM